MRGAQKSSRTWRTAVAALQPSVPTEVVQNHENLKRTAETGRNEKNNVRKSHQVEVSGLHVDAEKNIRFFLAAETSKRATEATKQRWQRRNESGGQLATTQWGFLRSLIREALEEDALRPCPVNGRSDDLKVGHWRHDIFAKRQATGNRSD